MEIPRLFAWKNLDDPEAELQEVIVEHEVATLSPDMKDGQFLGGRSHGSHFWNGTLKRLRCLVSRNRQGTPNLQRTEPRGRKVSAHLDLDLSSNPEEVLEKKGFLLLSSGTKDAPSPRLEALTALCHAVLTSNEFLYLH